MMYRKLFENWKRYLEEDVIEEEFSVDWEYDEFGSAVADSAPDLFDQTEYPGVVKVDD